MFVSNPFKVTELALKVVFPIIFLTGLYIVIRQLWSDGFMIIFNAIYFTIVFAILFALMGVLPKLIATGLPSQSLLEKDITRDRITLIAFLLSILLGGVLGIGLVTSLLNPPILLSITGLGVSLTGTLLYPVVKHRLLIARYRKSEQNLIQP
ncbi:MAG: hypothetical protein WBA13_18930 [Microcoleaceae cyanobacterium]